MLLALKSNFFKDKIRRVIIMVFIFNQVSFPPEEANKIATAYIEWLKDNPPDNTIEKNICIGVKSTEDGNILVLGIGDVVKGKAEEALQETTKQNLFLASRIKDFKYKAEVILNYTEAYKILGMTAPEV